MLHHQLGSSAVRTTCIDIGEQSYYSYSMVYNVQIVPCVSFSNESVLLLMVEVDFQFIVKIPKISASPSLVTQLVDKPTVWFGQGMASCCTTLVL